IAVWDGQKAAGRGGTAEIVQYAAASHVPIWWINSASPFETAMILERNQLRRRAPASRAALDDLKHLLRRTLSPPMPVHARRPGLVGATAYFGRRLFKRNPSALIDYLEESQPSRSCIWHTYNVFLKLIAPSKRGAVPPVLAPVGTTEIWWRKFYDAADTLSV